MSDPPAPLPPPAAAPAPPRPPSPATAWLLVVGALLASVAVAAAILLGVRGRAPELCAATPKVLAGLGEPIEVTAYVTHGLPLLDAFAAQLELLLARYQAAGGGRFKYAVVDVKTDDDARRAKDDGLQATPFGDASGGKVVTGFLGVALRYKKERDRLATLAPDQPRAVEFWLTSKIREMAARADDRAIHLGLLSGVGEIALDEPDLTPGPPAAGGANLVAILRQYFPFYALEKVDLGAGGHLDDRLAGLLVTQPGRDLTDAELGAIDAFVMKGRALAVFAGAVNVPAGDPAMHATLGTHGLERLLSGYGVELHRDLAADFGAPYKLELGAPGLARVSEPAIPRVEGARLDGASPQFFRLGELAFPFASSITLHPEAQPTGTFRLLARTSDQGAPLGEVGEIGPRHVWTSPGTMRALDLAASVEGRLGAALPSTQPRAVEEGRLARVLVVGSSGFFTNPFVRAARGVAPDAPGADELAILGQAYAQRALPSTIIALRNTLDWLSFDDDFAACAAELVADPPKGR